jgi:hypothetical protein
MARKLNPARDRAANALRHYIRLAAEHGPAYLTLDGDCDTEIGGIVDDIIDAAVEEALERQKAENTQGDEVPPATPPTPGNPQPETGNKETY